MMKGTALGGPILPTRRRVDIRGRLLIQGVGAIGEGVQSI